MSHTKLIHQPIIDEANKLAADNGCVIYIGVPVSGYKEGEFVFLYEESECNEIIGYTNGVFVFTNMEWDSG